MKNTNKKKSVKAVTKPTDKKPKQRERLTFFSTDTAFHPDETRAGIAQRAYTNTFQKSILDFKPVNAAGNKVKFAADASPLQETKLAYSGFQAGIPDAALGYYGNQGFIGYQACAMLMQNWLIDKICTIPARDAVRKGYEIAINDGKEVDPATIAAIRKLDKKYKLRDNCVEFVRFGKCFGIRIAMFVIDGVGDDFYLNPFNIDGVKAGSYKGINQIDPYWITPELDMKAASNPAALDFYEPTWWRINGKRIHRSHLIIYRTGEVPDIMKPSYIYGGVSIPQKIYERVYAAERCANEAPQLLLTKRATTLKTDTTQALADQATFEQKMQEWAYFRDNFGIKIFGTDEEVMQFETSLTNLDEIILGQYELACATGNVPVTKVMGIQPTGLGATGEYDEASYHEELESTQEHDLTPLIDRHYQLVIKSDLKKEFEVTVNWLSLDALTAKEQADINKTKADTDAIYVDMGAVDNIDVHKKLIADPDSGYNGLEDDEDSDDVAAAKGGDPADGSTPQQGGKTLPQISMTGVQITAVIEILTGVASNKIPPDSAKATLAAAFPLTEEQINGLVDPVALKAKTDPIEEAPAKPVIDPKLKPAPDKPDGSKQ